MGVVWIARNEATGGEVALKFLLESAALCPRQHARLRREARATASLSHRGVVQVFDLLETDGRLALVLESLHGHTLAERIDAEEQLAPVDAVRIALDLLSALSHVHGAGIVHRDIKPANVFLASDPDGHMTTKLLDFGISKSRFDGAGLTMGGEVVGTPSYMSPEQAMGHPVDARTDVFAMGILLYEMLGGKNPFAGADKPILSVVLLADHVAPIASAPPALWAVIARALKCNPDERFASAAEMANALRGAMSGRIGKLSRPRARYLGALVAASLLVWVSVTAVIAPPTAFSAAHAPPRLRAQRFSVSLDQNACERSNAGDARMGRADAPAPRPQLADVARDPGF